MTKSILSLALMASMAIGASAQTAPVLRHVPAGEGGGDIMAVSDNGLWGVGVTFTDGFYNMPRLLDVQAGELIDLFAANQTDIIAQACDVTDDGQTIAGCWNSLPAIYPRMANAWRQLPLPENGYTDGEALSITPDGRIAVGRLYRMSSEGYDGIAVAWDLSTATPQLISLTNLPDFDVNGNPSSFLSFSAVSPDGRYALGTVDFVYPMTAWNFVYDLQNNTWQPIGYTYTNGALVPDANYFVSEMGGFFTKDSKNVAIVAGEDETSRQFCLYNIETASITPVATVSDMLFCDYDKYGVAYGAAPSTPNRNWSFYAGGYWYEWKQALLQLYGIDWQNDFLKDDMGLSGTVVGVSDDATRILVADYTRSNPGGCFLITLPAPLAELAENLDPLANYAFFPQEMSSFSALRTLNVYFDRDVEVVGDTRGVEIREENGEVLKNSLNVALEAGSTRTVVVSFRNAELEAGKTYTVVIPEGMIQAKDDPAHKNKEMTVKYVGRANEPVKPVRIAPEDGTAISLLNMNTNPVTVQFDAVLSVIDGGSIALYREENGTEEFLYSLSSTIEGNVMTIYPVMNQQLFKGIDYKVVIEPNTVGDIAGNNGNERIVINYVGAYVPEVNTDGDVVYSIDFNSGFEDMMLYDGDQKTPQAVPASWDFTSEYPWWTVRDSEEDMEQAAASHSMYVPAGQSDDWMVTPRQYIPDANCKLTFDSQSYKRDKNDVLKVYILETSDLYTAPITKSFIDRIKAEGKLVYNEKQDPGESEELLAGDWRSNKIDLSEYNEKYIYVAFCNDNDDQSAIFVDNIVIGHDMVFSFANTSAVYVEDKESMPVSVSLKMKEEGEFDKYSFRLLDADGGLVVEDTPALSLGKDEEYTHTFSKELPLQKGSINEYTIEVEIGEELARIPSTVKNVRFVPEKKIVIEEVTGTQCGWCPQGHQAFELINGLYGDKVIPVAIHGYSGGSYLSGNTTWSQTYCTVLGMSAAPAGSVNREVIASPMITDAQGKFGITSASGDQTWCDYISVMLGQPTDASLGIKTAKIDPQTGLIEVDVDMQYAYDNPNVNLTLHTVVLENELVSRQSNNCSAYTDEILGEWRKGGSLGTDPAMYVFNHVARGMNGNSYNGVSGMYPHSIESDKVYNNVYAFEIPSVLTDASKADVVVMLIDANSGRVINSDKMACEVAAVGIDGVEADMANARGDVYNVAGVCVLRDATIDQVNRLDKGIYIFNGKKVMVR